MMKRNDFTAYVLIGIGVYFLISQLNLSLFSNFYSWPTFLMIIGIAYLIHSYGTKEYYHIFTGVLLLGLGIHFHGLENYSFWFDHWSVYALIVGIAFFIRYLKTGEGMIPAGILIGVSLLMILSVTLPAFFRWMYWLVDFLGTFWPVALIGIGVYLLRSNK